MTDFRIMKVAAIDCQIADVTDIEVMGLTIAITVIRELTIINNETIGRSVSAKQSILVVVEVAVVKREITCFIADSGAIAIVYRCSGKFKVVNRDITICNKNTFAVRNVAASPYQLNHPTNA